MLKIMTSINRASVEKRMDTLSKLERSARMALVKGRNTGPERVVRSVIRSTGWRYCAHVQELPGTPDFVLPNARTALFVHGCFWHRHSSTRCKLARLPKSRLAFWRTKLDDNAKRDRRTYAALHRRGWSVLVVWECQLGELDTLTRRLKRLVGDRRTGK